MTNLEEAKTVQTRDLPEKVDVYVIAEDGTISEGVGYDPEIFIEETDVGQLYDKNVALRVRRECGSVIGVMRDASYSTAPKEYKTHKMILGKVDFS